MAFGLGAGLAREEPPKRWLGRLDPFAIGQVPQTGFPWRSARRNGGRRSQARISFGWQLRPTSPQTRSDVAMRRRFRKPTGYPQREDKMEAKIDEIAEDIYRLSVHVSDIAPPAGLTFNHFLLRGEEPLLFHTGLRRMFPIVHAAVARLIPPETLRWITFGHYEADECGAMNEWLEAAPQAQVAHGQIGCMVSLNDIADRTPTILEDGARIELGGGLGVRYLDTPHIPHGWDAGVLLEERSGTLLCGDLFTQLGNGPALTEGDIVGPAIAAEDMFQASSLNPGMGATIRRLAALAPGRLALMHGPSFRGDGASALRALADDYDRRVGEAFAAAGRSLSPSPP
jgi:glyoxylase-like metal-dependent hydrolase (beta-lactamase superfamily II)